MKRSILLLTIIMLLAISVPTLGAVAVNGTDVTFTWKDPDAKKVAVSGSFNGWNPAGIQMAKGADGVWSITMKLEPKSYQYKFVVNGAWTVDKDNPAGADDGYGAKNALFVVADPATGCVATVPTFVPMAFFRFRSNIVDNKDLNGSVKDNFIFQAYWKAAGTMFKNWDYYSEISNTIRFGDGYDRDGQGLWEGMQWNPSNYDDGDDQTKIEHLKLTYTAIPDINLGIRLNGKAWDFHDPLVILQSNGDSDYIYKGTRIDITVKDGAPVKGGLGFGTCGGYKIHKDIKYPSARVAYGELYKDFGAYTVGAAATYKSVYEEEADGKVTYDDTDDGLSAVWFKVNPISPLTLTTEYVVSNASSVDDASTSDKSAYLVKGEYKLDNAKFGLSYFSKGPSIVSAMAGDKSDLNQWRRYEDCGAIVDASGNDTYMASGMNKISAWTEYSLNDTLSLTLDCYNKTEKDDSGNSIYKYTPGVVLNNVAGFMPKLGLSYSFFDTPDKAEYANQFRAVGNFINDYNVLLWCQNYHDAYDWSNNEITGTGYKFAVNKLLTKLPYKPRVFVYYLHNWFVPNSTRYGYDGDDGDRNDGDFGFASGFQIKLEYDIK